MASVEIPTKEDPTMSVFEQIFSDPTLTRFITTEGQFPLTAADYTFLKFCGITIEEELEPEVREPVREAALCKLAALRKVKAG